MERLTNTFDPSGYFYPPGYNLGSNVAQPPVVKLETSDPSLHLTGPTGRGGVVKYCGVCGDVAKSYHFGGLSCDSCKAFFRRSVQNDNYLHFQCCHRGQCTISLSNRKSCQYCRMKRCFAIGMEKSWVMTEEERKALMKARAEKKLSKQLAASATATTTGGKSIFDPSSSSDDGGSTTSDYEPQIERMIDFLAPVEIKEIESIVTKYVHAYQHVPYRTELRFYDNDRPGAQVMEMFGTLIRRFAFYARLMPDFSSLPFQDQSSLLRGGVLEMCVLRGALVYDPLTNRWPNANMSMYKDAPVLKLGNIGHMTSNRIFQMHMEFINCIQQMGVDEPTIMLLILIVLFTPERAGLVRIKWVEKYQTYYTSLLERYMSWRFGTARSTFIFGKLLTKLSDLRELSENHNRHNMQLAKDEISSIQHQLQHLKINPYSEYKVIPDDSTLPAVGNEPEVQRNNVSCPVNNSQTYYDATSDPPQQSNQADVSGMSYSTIRQPMIHQQPYPSLSEIHPNAQQQQHHHVDPSHGGASAGSYADPYRNQEQQPQQMANMAMQFMQPVQNFVQQVVDIPYFGFEWVKPDYQFDPLVDDELMESFGCTPPQPSSISGSVDDPLSPAESNATSSFSYSSNENAQASFVDAKAALSPRTMELYEALEEFSELHGFDGTSPY